MSRATIIVGEICLMAGLSGCLTPPPVARRAADFSAKAAPTLVEARGVYDLVETTHARRKRAERIAAYDTTAFDAPAANARFGSEADLKARKDVLDLLQRYVEALAAVSGDEPLTAEDAPSKEAAAQVGAIATSSLSALKGSAQATLSDTDLTAASVAIDALARLIVDRKRARALPSILDAASGPVTTLCDLLRKDLGDPQTGGLRYVLRIDFEGIETTEDAAIRDHPKEYSYPEKREAIDALYQLLDEQAAADAKLVKADAALADFAKTHAALAKSAHEKRAPGFRALLAELTTESQQLADIETSLSKKASK